MKSPKILLLGALILCVPAFAQQTETRFDDNWRFHRGEVSGAENVNFNDATWRRVQLPHDWSIEDLPPAPPQLVLSGNGWRFHAGDDAAWKAPNFDDSAWTPFAAPATYQGLPPFAPQSYGWYRRKFDVPAALRGQTVELVMGKVDDVDETFVNGVKVGATGTAAPDYRGAYNELRHYPVPANLLRGDGSDVVAVRVYNGEGSGGLYAPAGAQVRSGPFDSLAPGGAAQGFAIGGVGWYRKTFQLPASQRNRVLRVTFDGVYMNSTVWFNGQELPRHPYGYTSFSYDLTPLMRVGQSNVLAVRADASGLTSRWYSGAGIYRHVHLTSAPPVHFAENGVSITTPEVAAKGATVRANSAIANDDKAAHEVTWTARVVDASGKIVAAGRATQTVAAGAVANLETRIALSNPQLWSPDKPTLYRLIGNVNAGAGGTSETAATFGIRAIAFDAARGFMLNGTPVLLRGGCVHHDNGPLGSAAYDRAEERRVELLKAAGFNAIRTSHNPPSPAFLAACDRLGMLVIDEAFDAWNNGKNADDYAKYFALNWRDDVRSMIERDRNHASVIQWSIGNEIPEQTNEQGIATAKLLAEFARSLDPTRPTTLACNLGYSAGRDAYFSAVGVAGYNYLPNDYIKDHERHPTWLMQGTESFPLRAFEAWMPVEDHPYVIGDFVWTSFDYIGEAGIGRVVRPGEPGGFLGQFPTTVAGCGDLDITGVRKPQSYYRGVMWGVGPRVVAFVNATPQGEPTSGISAWGWGDEHASWTWPGTEGKNREVRVYANTPRVKLLLNGRDLGTKPAGRAAQFTATYSVPYEPGALVAIGLDDAEKEVERWTLQTAGAPAQIRLTPDRATIAADGQDLSYIGVEVLDAAGNLCPQAANLVKFALAGPGQIIGVGNGDPRNIESFQAPQHSAFEGRALVIVKSGGAAGTLRLTASAPGLKSATANVQTVVAR